MINIFWHFCHLAYIIYTVLSNIRVQYSSKESYQPLAKCELHCGLRDSLCVLRMLHDSCSVLCDSRRAPWPNNCKYHCQNSKPIPRMKGKALQGLTRIQILTYTSCRLLRIIHFVEDWYLRICAKHAFKKVTLKPMHHLENYIFFFQKLWDDTKCSSTCNFLQVLLNASSWNES